ncbi:hypothetical protein GCM10023340_38600 [Nocardioides marinquilinus]|uniref:DNA-binding protein n=1 Tax=Nocardioides marinquilinus TaxID=1210400 RepID=A0ABP9Q008_9ACTN
MTGDLITEAELAEVLKITESRAAALRRENGWRFTKLGRAIRYTPAQVEAIITGHEAGGADATATPLIPGQSRLSAARSQPGASPASTGSANRASPH